MNCCTKPGTQLSSLKNRDYKAYRAYEYRTRAAMMSCSCSIHDFVSSSGFHSRSYLSRLYVYSQTRLLLADFGDSRVGERDRVITVAHKFMTTTATRCI